MNTPPSFFSDAVDVATPTNDEFPSDHPRKLDPDSFHFTPPEDIDSPPGIMSQDPSAYMTVSSAWGPLVPNPLSLYGHNYHSQYATKQEDIDDRPVLSIVPSVSTSQSSVRADSSISMQTQTSKSSRTTDPADASPPRKKGRKSKAPAQGENDGKRDKFLERNRVAASKCRQKKKEWVSDLQETKQGLENQHAQLQMEYNGLVNEVTRMKNELMSHANCNDPNINLWLENEARRFVQISADRVKKQSLDASRAVGDRPLGMGGSYMPSIDSQMSLISPSHSERAMTTMSSRSGSSADINYDHMPDSAFEQA
ncbi:bZIP transcription factor [Colletotrichum higginsianum]|uniref:BZIP transcription factor n=2 Tax=Colletotrichum higginsianum TaxID=80884 RepID=H1V8T6_COLHI|nr:BZIP transcription factor [Colletotrichum higginsianum IMI 349063]OBR10941.1 BZIP transcription factor [Colletotrichum higginsianum IMI 349063]CCF36639.1 bZIP transcription factor [Colletotrichum higginsianum]